MDLLTTRKAIALEEKLDSYSPSKKNELVSYLLQFNTAKDGDNMQAPEDFESWVNIIQNGYTHIPTTLIETIEKYTKQLSDVYKVFAAICQTV